MYKAETKKQLPALALKGNELIFYRRYLGMERVVPDIGVRRNEYIKNVIVPVLQPIDARVMAIREENAERLASGQFKTTEDGRISYGENEEQIRKQFEELLEEDVILPIENPEEFALCRSIFQGLKQELDENETYVYSEVLEKLNSVNL